MTLSRSYDPPWELFWLPFGSVFMKTLSGSEKKEKGTSNQCKHSEAWLPSLKLPTRRFKNVYNLFTSFTHRFSEIYDETFSFWFPFFSSDDWRRRYWCELGCKATSLNFIFRSDCLPKKCAPKVFAEKEILLLQIQSILCKILFYPSFSFSSETWSAWISWEFWERLSL